MSADEKWCPMCGKYGDHTSGQCPQLAWLRNGEVLYGIANETRECYGHGDYGSETRIVRQGAYGGGEFPPLFRSKASAERYVAIRTGMKVVELTLYP